MAEQIVSTSASAPLVLGTFNLKKRDELAVLLAPTGITVRTLADFDRVELVDETGDTFTANAELKASGYARALGHWVLADDSGLAVDALAGAPGVISAHFAGLGATDHDNNQLLLERLKQVPLERRTAHYVCHLSLADPSGAVRAEAEEYCGGRILEREYGSQGFGYDPLFEVIELHRTFGQLSPLVKACLSHRARALRKIVVDIERLLKQP